jgi:hypothetical protein
MKKKNLLMTVVAIFGLVTISNAQLPNYIPTNGLVGWWPFNGNASDESLNGNNGTITGATLTTDRFGVMNNAYNFDGISNYIDVGNPSSLGNNPNSYTQAGWVYLVDFSDAYVFMSKRHDNTGNDWGTPVSTVNGTFIFFADDAFYQQAPLAETNQLSLGQWHHLAFVKNQNTFSIYVNGVLDGSMADNHIMGGSSNNLIFGAQLAWPEFFKGKLDDIGVWNRALTVCEVQDLFNAQLNSSASIQAGTDVSICEGNDVIFNGSGGSNYTWNNGVQNGVAYIPTISQEYIVIGQDTNNCYGTDTIYVELMPNTAATQTQTALDSYTWPINSQTYTQSGTYTAVIPNAAGCDSTITLELSLAFTGLVDNSQGALFSVFPNPAQSAINIKANISIIGEFYTIYDNAGRVVLNGKINSENATIELGNLTRGIYMFSVGENMKQTFKVIKE